MAQIQEEIQDLETPGMKTPKSRKKSRRPRNKNPSIQEPFRFYPPFPGENPGVRFTPHFQEKIQDSGLQPALSHGVTAGCWELRLGATAVQLLLRTGSPEDMIVVFQSSAVWLKITENNYYNYIRRWS